MSGAAITVPLNDGSPYRELAVRLVIVDGDELARMLAELQETRDARPGRPCATCGKRRATLELAPTYGRPHLLADPDPTPLCGPCLANAVREFLAASGPA